MGRKLIINGADFSKNSVNKVVSDGAIAGFPSMASVVSGEAGWLVINYNSTRMTLTNNFGKGIRLPAGYKIKLDKLKGRNGNATALWIDYIIYSTPNIPMVLNTNVVGGNAANLIATGSNFVSSNYFPLNHGNGTFVEVTNPCDHDVYIVFVAKAGSAGSAITVTNYVSSVDGLHFYINPIS